MPVGDQVRQDMLPAPPQCGQISRCRRTPEKTREPAGHPLRAPISRRWSRKLAELEEQAGARTSTSRDEVRALRAKRKEKLVETYAGLSAWDQVTVASHPDRPVTGDYVARAFWTSSSSSTATSSSATTPPSSRAWRASAIAASCSSGTARAARPRSGSRCNFGCAHPEGYRKALRKMQLAEKLGLPIVTMINTPGAYPGIGAEERGQAAAIAENILEMFELRSRSCYVIGEGGSGGALGIGIGDRVLMLQYAYYSVISPEGCAAILWKDGARTPEARRGPAADRDHPRGPRDHRRRRRRAPGRGPPGRGRDDPLHAPTPSSSSWTSLAGFRRGGPRGRAPGEVPAHRVDRRALSVPGLRADRPCDPRLP